MEDAGGRSITGYQCDGDRIMTDTEKKLYKWVKEIYDTNGVSFGYASFAGVSIKDMTQKELALLCNILANELYSGTTRIKVSIELERNNG